MKNAGLVTAGGDLEAIYNKESMKALINTEDLIGITLRIHFMLEGFLDLWCSKMAHCEDFFDFNNNIPFNTKLEISKKLGLPTELATVFKIFNQKRNKFAHQVNYAISDEDLETIRHAVDQIPVNVTPKVSRIEDIFILQSDQKKIGWSTSDISTKQKLLLLFSLSQLKIINIFTNEFEAKGIVFSF